MDFGQGFPEWTELAQDSGLDPLGMQRPIEAIYQSLVPGISTITLRFRYYSFFSFILRHYEKKIRHPDPEKFRLFQRKCEALFALICTYGQPELGITGSDWATRTLNDAAMQGSGAMIDFSVGADPSADVSLRYLRNKGGAFGAIYSTQMAEMGLIHFAGPHDLNPNPVCSDAALGLAAALGRELGPIAERFFAVVEDGKIALSSLADFEAMKPNNLKPGSEEHTLLTGILLGKSQARSPTDERRRSTLQMLLDVTAASASIPQAEAVKWRWYENVSDLRGGDAGNVLQLWFLYQACDLLRLAYEVILSAGLTLLEISPRRRMALGDLTDELVGFGDIPDGASWGDYAHDLTTNASRSPVQERAQLMLAAMEQGDTPEQVSLAVSLIALLSVQAQDAGRLMDGALRSGDHFQSLKTEAHYLDQLRAMPAVQVIAGMIRERVLKRHLWVASRKFRNQKAYTFLMEPEDGVLRYRSHFRVSPSSPRLDQALRFLRDIRLIDENGITPIGRAELVAA